MQHNILDPTHQGMIVGAFEHPPEWRAQSNVVWNFQNTSHPVVVYAAAFNPGGTESFEFLPVEACCWLEPHYGFDPVGSQKFGLTLLPPRSSVETLTQWLIPKYRGNRGNLRLVDARVIPDLARMLQATELQSIPNEGVSAKIEYQEHQTVFEEEFYACRYQFPPNYGQITQQNWGLTRVFCFRAERGKLDAAKPTFWRIAGSLYNNPQWQDLFQQVTRRLNGQFEQAIQAGYDKLRSEAQFQQQLTTYYQQQRDQQNANLAWGIERQHQQNIDRSAGGYSAQDGWSDAALMGRTAYEDPQSREGNFHYESGNYQYVWTDGQGGWQPTNDPNFDPNIGSNASWTLAKKIRE